MLPIKKILIASNNSGKIKEISDLLLSCNIKPLTLSDFECFKNFQEPEEDGENFAQNALIKAKFYANLAQIPALSDDSGLCIEALDNQPGINSARFALDENGQKNFPKAFDKIFASLENKDLNIEKNKIKAHFICNLTLFDPATNFHISFEGRVDGKITKPRGNKGFGYDPIFVKNDMDKTFGEILPKEKDQISHRAIAFTQFLNWHEKSSHL